ncbi:UNVERIFIED_CONTAM: protein MALE DISCOVERER 2 [Sesamum angustifolium]|uniref:Protein MALE DISCOVERER 2 n=1 Tax=Sesamum angustifolium TaxID=2727405 RepID=A0AAW2KUC5_9LAMI
MVWRAMSGRWNAYGAPFSLITFFILVLRIHGCWSLNSEGLALQQFRAKVDFDPSGALVNWNTNDSTPCMWPGVHCLDGQVDMIDLNGYDLEGVLAPELGNLSHLRVLILSKNHLSGTIPREFGQLTTLEVLDLRDNKLTGTVPAELGRLHSLKHLLLCDNRFEGSMPVEIGKLGLLTDLQFDEILTTASAGAGCMGRKFGHCIWQSVIKQSEKSNSFQVPTKGTIIRYLNLFQLFKLGSELSPNHADDSPTNLTDLPESDVIWNVENQVNNVRRILVEQSSNLVAIPPKGGIPAKPEPVTTLPSRSSGSFPAIPNSKKLSPPSPATSPTSDQEHPDTTNAAAVGQPTDKQSSDTGKSGNSVKLIVGLSVGVFLLILAAVIIVICRSRAAKTIAPWKTGLSGQLQKAFVTGVPKLNRDELETACEDFSNIISTDEGVATVYKGTLSSGVEIAVASTAIVSLKDWSKRSELVFRNKIDTLSRVNHKNFLNLIGYCEEDEPFTRMMIADISFWAELVGKIKNTNPADTESAHSVQRPHADVETNIHSFGILLLEIITGRPPYSEEEGNLMIWAAQYLNDKSTISKLVDPSLKSFKDNELEVVCEVVQSCTQHDAPRRPSMKEVIQKLRQEIDISPDAATPRLSPLWWAELEILSAEAA